MSLGHKFLLAFVPLLVAVDPIGVMPFYVGMVGKMDAKRRNDLLLQALATAWIGGTAFTLVGRALFGFLAITVNDFKIAGGLILLVLSIYDLLFANASREAAAPGAVPLGIPLIVGPAVLTSLLMEADVLGVPASLAAFTVNLAIVLAVFLAADRVRKLVGDGAMQATSKIFSLLLAAFAVMMLRTGLTAILRGT